MDILLNAGYKASCRPPMAQSMLLPSQNYRCFTSALSVAINASRRTAQVSHQGKPLHKSVSIRDAVKRIKQDTATLKSAKENIKYKFLIFIAQICDSSNAVL